MFYRYRNPNGGSLSLRVTNFNLIIIDVAITANNVRLTIPLSGNSGNT